ncbi:hypothetical protein JQM84_00530 [Parabacteroides distasonis]|nr:hypothetical protein [Parabacteroides distasonis]
MRRNEELQKYLANKHRGGENNLKGGTYEDFYAVYQIVSCLTRFKDRLDTVQFQAQLEDAFVDDLLIAYPEINVYHQLKNTQDISWGDPQKKGDIAFDFAHQIEDCKERNEAFSLKLVHSANKAEIDTKMPEEIKDFSAGEWFSYYGDINQMVLLCEDLRSTLKAISGNSAEITDDELTNIATVFLGAWKALSFNRKVKLAELLHKVESQTRVNLSIYPDQRISDACQEILDAIEGIEYYVRGKMFYCRFGHFTGLCPWPDEMEERIISNHPTTKMELFMLIK